MAADCGSRQSQDEQVLRASGHHGKSPGQGQGRSSGKYQGKAPGTRLARVQRTVQPQRAGAVAGAFTPWRETVAATVAGLGYELVDIERVPAGTLRVYIDRVPGRLYASGAGEFVTVDDCEQVTRQLQYALEVDSVSYARLEVSSPGLDRPLRTEADYQRFAGQEVSLTLKLPFQGRKVWKGVLGRADEGGRRPARRSPRHRRWVSRSMKCARHASCRWLISRVARPPTAARWMLSRPTGRQQR